MLPEITPQLIATIAYMAFLLFQGAKRRYGFATWHMFARSGRGHICVYFTDAAGTLRDVNPWDYLPHTLITLDMRLAELFLAYLRDRHRILAQGKVLFIRAGQRTIRKVADGCVVA